MATPAELLNETLTGSNRREGLRLIGNPNWSGLRLIDGEEKEEGEGATKNAIGTRAEERTFSIEMEMRAKP